MSPAKDSWATVISNSIFPTQIKLNTKREYVMIPVNQLLCTTRNTLISYNPYSAFVPASSIVLAEFDESPN